MQQHGESGPPDRNIKGFLKHRSDWTESVALEIAEKEGVTLTDKHWDIIHFIRTEFYANHGIVPMETQIKRGMEQAWNASLTDDDLNKLFPGGPNRQGAKIAGCITMKTVEDLLMVKGDSAWTIKPDQSVQDAIRLLAQWNIGALMVVEDNKLVGIVSERDYTRSVFLKGYSSEATPVSQIMTAEVFSVSPEDTLETCMELMIDRGFRHLPVLEHGQLAGVLSMPDLVKVIVEQHRFKISQLQDKTH